MFKVINPEPQYFYILLISASDFKKHLIVKIRNDDPRYIKLGVKILHENEMLAYVKILPLLNDEEFCTVPLPIPKVYYAFKNVIIMEDLNDKSFYFPDKSIKGISSHQCRIILKVTSTSFFKFFL